jgi:outer membrane protein assembly factor BamD (BamD/ComL family)
LASKAPVFVVSAGRAGRAAHVPKPKDAALADASTLAEQNLLFRRAVDARNEGEDERAVKHFDALLGKYPKSALAQEARVERFRALKRLGRNREAAREARRYLMDHTNGFAKDEARGLALTPGVDATEPK